jgi:5-methyltetrahydrofolate--homocysteine methyltransferase
MAKECAAFVRPGGLEDVPMADFGKIVDAVQSGRAPVVKELVNAAVQDGSNVSDILNLGLVQGIMAIGELFKRNEVYVPEVLIAARAMYAGLNILRPLLVEQAVEPTGTVVIGTVKGDLHDIGKNLVAMMLEGTGFSVTDLGTDITPERFADEVATGKYQILCMSALLTTTMPNMKATIQLLEQRGIRDKVKVMIGGAPVTQTYANEIGADGYSTDAASATELAKRLVGKA